jgi:hypothetical protein
MNKDEAAGDAGQQITEPGGTGELVGTDEQGGTGDLGGTSPTPPVAFTQFIAPVTGIAGTVLGYWFSKEARR